MSWRSLNLRFESRVVLDGSQAPPIGSDITEEFESRVVLDGSQASCLPDHITGGFESRVVLDGSQALLHTYLFCKKTR